MTGAVPKHKISRTCGFVAKKISFGFVQYLRKEKLFYKNIILKQETDTKQKRILKKNGSLSLHIHQLQHVKVNLGKNQQFPDLVFLKIKYGCRKSQFFGESKNVKHTE